MLLLLTEIVAVLFAGLSVLARPNGLRSLGRLLLLAAVATLPWGGIQLGGVPIGDIPLILSIIPLLITARRGSFTIPSPVLVGAALVALTAVVTSFQPPSFGYLAGRLVPLSYAESIGVIVRSTGNLSSAAKYEISIFLLPLVMILACSHGTAFARKIGVAWAAGIVVNSAIAFSDYIGATNISVSVVGYSIDSGRQSGLSQQPNFIGVEAAMAIPIILASVIQRRGPQRIALMAGLVICILGVYVSGSRGSAIGAALAVPITLLVSPEARRWTGRLAVVSFAGCVYLILSPSGATILGVLRLATTATDTTTQSDIARAATRHQGLSDFLYSPIHGIGWDHSFEAHVIYIQLVAAGGLVAAFGMLIYVGGILRRAWVHVRPVDPFTGALIASVITWLVIGLVENQLTDQWIYVPLATLAGMAAHWRGTPTGGPGPHPLSSVGQFVTDKP